MSPHRSLDEIAQEAEKALGRLNTVADALKDFDSNEATKKLSEAKLALGELQRLQEEGKTALDDFVTYLEQGRSEAKKLIEEMEISRRNQEKDARAQASKRQKELDAAIKQIGDAWRDKDRQISTDIKKGQERLNSIDREWQKTSDRANDLLEEYKRKVDKATKAKAQHVVSKAFKEIEEAVATVREETIAEIKKDSKRTKTALDKVRKGVENSQQNADCANDSVVQLERIQNRKLRIQWIWVLLALIMALVAIGLTLQQRLGN